MEFKKYIKKTLLFFCFGVMLLQGDLFARGGGGGGHFHGGGGHFGGGRGWHGGRGYYGGWGWGLGLGFGYPYSYYGASYGYPAGCDPVYDPNCPGYVAPYVAPRYVAPWHPRAYRPYYR